MGRWTKLVEMLGVNSIPVLGVFVGDWSSSTGLAVYWFENLIASLLIGARLWLHRRWQAPVDSAGQPVPRAKPPSALLVTAIPFTVAHGLFLLLVFLIVTRIAPDPDQLRRAAVALLALQGIAFGIDLWTLATWPAARVNERADHLLGRVVLVHLSIIVGMFLFAWLERPGAFFGFFVGCKVLTDLSAFLPRPDPGMPERPPRWLAAIMRRFPRQNGETFEAYWIRTHKPGADPGADPRGFFGRRPAADDPGRQAAAAKALTRRGARRGRRR